MRFSVILDGFAFAVFNAICDLTTTAAPSNLLDRSIRSRLTDVSAIALKRPDRFSHAIHADKIKSNHSAKSLTSDVDAKIRLIFGARLGAEHLPAF
jgi:hypothetical protein